MSNNPDLADINVVFKTLVVHSLSGIFNLPLLVKFPDNIFSFLNIFWGITLGDFFFNNTHNALIINCKTYGSR